MKFLLFFLFLAAQNAFALSCSDLLSEVTLSIDKYEVARNSVLMTEQSFYELSISDLHVISNKNWKVFIEKNGKNAIGPAQGASIIFSPVLPKDTQYAIEVMERLARSSVPKSFRKKGEDLNNFTSLVTPHPMEPWHSYKSQSEVGLWLVRLRNGNIEGQLFSSGNRFSFSEQDTIQAWNSLLNRIDPSQIVSVDQYHTHPFKVGDTEIGMGPFSVFSSGGDQNLAFNFRNNPPRGDELDLEVEFNFYAVSRVYQEMVISRTPSVPQKTELPDYFKEN